MTTTIPPKVTPQVTPQVKVRGTDGHLVLSVPLAPGILGDSFCFTIQFKTADDLLNFCDALFKEAHQTWPESLWLQELFTDDEGVSP